MNEHLSERFGRSKRGARDEGQGSTAQVLILPPKLNPLVQEYFKPAKVDGGAWLDRPEVPSSAEVMDMDDASSSSTDVVELLPNRPEGAWESKEEYLSTQYELYREDAIRGIREAVTNVRCTPDAVEDTFNGKIGIYEKVHVCGLKASTRGIALHVTFSTRRAGKLILWEQTKRLVAGSIVVLSPLNDKFRTKAIVATVAARPLENLKDNPPRLDLFFARSEELELDPSIEYIMVEDRGGLFEANRHTLLALQRMMREPFPLSEHIVDARKDIPSPAYLQEQPLKNLTPVLDGNDRGTYENVNILSNWPAKPNSKLDASQLEALHRMLTKQLAVVQGPPGTGKTFVSVQAVRVMLENRRPGDPPILIACQTNHAIDQFLRHVAEFEPEFLRLGGRSKDKDIVKKRTLFEVRNLVRENKPAGSVYGRADKQLRDLQKEIAVMLAPLKDDRKPLDVTVLASFNLLTEKQAQSLVSGASKWVQSAKTNVSDARASPFTVWLGDKLVVVPPKQQAEEHGFAFEEADLEFERLKDEEAEGAKDEDDFFDNLTGPLHPIADNWTCRKVPGITPTTAKDILSKHQDMWKVPEAARGAVYRHLQTEMKTCIATAIRAKAKIYDQQARLRRIGQFELDEPILKRQKVIGMTTTGLSKYRGILSALQPKIVLIEEAAETLEAPVTVGCMPTVQQLILVGDHQQLRPHTHVNLHQDEPWFLNVSLFERLVNNEIKYSILSRQRRMIPEIRRVLYPVYRDLIQDHPSVNDPENRPDVPGMGGVNSFFFTHQWGEDKDDFMSCFNDEEAKMIVGFVEYLIYNGVEAEEITILTFYNGQRKKLLSELRSRWTLQGRHFNVVTVDSYQGEENKVVILSLTRSNDNNQIGFLSVDNRTCVALSRAQCGFYIFGNGMLLYNAEALYSKDKSKKKKKDPETGEKMKRKVKSKTWTQVIEIMAGQSDQVEVPEIQPNRLGDKFPIRCKNHDIAVNIMNPEEWDDISGGCSQKCGDQLLCGHVCPLTCHPFSHEEVNCQICRVKAHDSTSSDYTLAVKDATNDQDPQHSREESSSGSSLWNDFATAEEQRVKQVFESYVPHSKRESPSKPAGNLWSMRSRSCRHADPICWLLGPLGGWCPFTCNSSYPFHLAHGLNLDSQLSSTTRVLHPNIVLICTMMAVKTRDSNRANAEGFVPAAR